MKVIEQHHPENREKGFIVNADQTQESTNDPAATHLDPYLSAVKRLDVIFSAANDYEEGARKMRDEFVVIPRADLPEVVEDGEYLRVDGVAFRKDHVNPANRRRIAFRNLTLAEHLEAKEAREAREAKAAEEAKLTARRDEVLREMVKASGAGYGHGKYALAHPVTQAAVDRIIEAKEAREAKAAEEAKTTQGVVTTATDDQDGDGQ